MVYQYYTIEIKRNQSGELAHEVNWAYDEDPEQANLKAQSLYYDKLSKAAVSEYASHSVTLISDEGYPVMYQCFKHPQTETNQ